MFYLFYVLRVPEIALNSDPAFNEYDDDDDDDDDDVDDDDKRIFLRYFYLGSL